MIFVKNFTLPDFHVRNLQYCSVFTHDIQSLNAFDLSNLDIFVRIELNYAVFEKKKKS